MTLEAFQSLPRLLGNENIPNQTVDSRLKCKPSVLEPSPIQSDGKLGKTYYNFNEDISNY